MQPAAPETETEPAECCDTFADARQFGLIQRAGGEFLLEPRNLADVNPDATAGNVETGETYDLSEFTLTMAISFCPFCGAKRVDRA
jgi:hypothetical protein